MIVSNILKSLNEKNTELSVKNDELAVLGQEDVFRADFGRIYGPISGLRCSPYMRRLRGSDLGSAYPPEIRSNSDPSLLVLLRENKKALIEFIKSGGYAGSEDNIIDVLPNGILSQRF